MSLCPSGFFTTLRDGVEWNRDVSPGFGVRGAIRVDTGLTSGESTDGEVGIQNTSEVRKL